MTLSKGIEIAAAREEIEAYYMEMIRHIHENLSAMHMEAMEKVHREQEHYKNDSEMLRLAIGAIWGEFEARTVVMKMEKLQLERRLEEMAIFAVPSALKVTP